MPVASHPERPLDCLLPVFCVILGEGWGEGETIASGRYLAHAPRRTETGRSVAGPLCGFRGLSDHDVC